MSKLYYHNGSGWVLVPDGTMLKYHNGSAWVNPLFLKYYDGSAWQTAWSKSDPVTYTYYPAWTQGYMSDTGNGQINGSILSGVADNDIVQGYWESTQGSVPGPAGTWGYVSSVIAFPDLADELAVRPVIKSATLRLTMAVGYGGDPKNTNVVMGHPHGVVGTSPPTTRSHTHTNQALQDTGDLFTANGQTKTITLNQAMRDTLETYRGIGIHDTADSTTETGKRATRAIFEGASQASSVRPLLTVTLDYI